MPKERKKVLCMDAQRHAEYYGMQRIFDELYAKSKAGETFTGLMELVLSPDNIMLAYRNIKTNTGSYTAGTDKQNIGDIGRLPPAEVIGKVRKIVTGSEHGYRPKPVRRKDIPKPNGKTRPLGIPCIWDRLVQQCIKQILEPICEAKFSNNSYGFRPNRSVEHAISRTYSLLQRAHLHYVLEFDIKGFFDNVNHSKLIKQLWTLGIQDKQLLFVIRRILKAPIRMPDGSTVYPTKGTPQGGIISPLLANVVLNELDHWIDSQWTEHPVANRYGTWRTIRTSEVFDKSNAGCMSWTRTATVSETRMASLFSTPFPLPTGAVPKRWNTGGRHGRSYATPSLRKRGLTFVSTTEAMSVRAWSFFPASMRAQPSGQWRRKAYAPKRASSTVG